MHNSGYYISVSGGYSVPLFPPNTTLPSGHGPSSSSIVPQTICSALVTRPFYIISSTVSILAGNEQNMFFLDTLYEAQGSPISHDLLSHLPSVSGSTYKARLEQDT